MMRVRLEWAQLEWKRQDLWIGAYFDRRRDGMHVWVCLLPCLPLHMVWSVN